MKDEKRPSYVGEKTVLLYLNSYKLPVKVTFPTSIKYNKAIDLIQCDLVEDYISYRKGDNRYMVYPLAVDAVIFPAEELTFRKCSHDMFLITILFDDGNKISVPITGEYRMRINYKQLEGLISSTPRDKFIKINQEENKAAYIRHVSPIIGIFTKKVEQNNVTD